MFDPSKMPRVFALPPGADFPAALVHGVTGRLAGQPPEKLAKTLILVNTRRMQRRLKDLFIDGGARLLPKIGLVSEIDSLFPYAGLPKPVSQLRRKLELMRLITALIEANPTRAPRAAIPDLADSLAALLDEMQGEGIGHDALQNINAGDHASHWQQSLQFLEIARDYTTALNETEADNETRQRLAAQALIDKWSGSPPTHPVIIAGSTGSRATTALLMQAVANLPQGALLLPGFDFGLPGPVWRDLMENRDAEDHPQYRYATLIKRLGISFKDVKSWKEPETSSPRNALISLSLRPAPVTDSWLKEGPDLKDLLAPTQNMSLLEAPSNRDEALAIAIALRLAIDKGQTAALITPDRTLGRRVTAALSRWGIKPDDSSGRPLSLTPPGRLLRQVARLIGSKAPADAMVALLKHPLVQTADDQRGQHLLWTHEFELFLRHKTSRFVDKEAIQDFAKKQPNAVDWCSWLEGVVHGLEANPPETLKPAIAQHITLAELLSNGAGGGTGELWEKAAGREVLAVINAFRKEETTTTPISFAHYARLLESTLASENTRVSDDSRSDIMIWGTLEARVQGADLVVLGGLNENTWPARPGEDPWLNRAMRRQAGMLLPERQIGLAAHDYQQAVAANHVILSRAERNDDGETVPSRWLNRLTNLLNGLPAQNGDQALKAMRKRGKALIEQARRLEAPAKQTSQEPRPAPAPPASIRPKSLSVTEIQTLIRDPYAIYAKHILRLSKLNPLSPDPDARLRGILFHDIAEQAIGQGGELTRSKLLESAEKVLSQLNWPILRSEWLGTLAQIADRIIQGELKRRAEGAIIGVEVKGEFQIPESEFSIRGKADRIDRLSDGTLAIHDYKTGSGPSAKQIKLFDRQLPIEAIMAELGGFKDLKASKVSKVSHIRLGRSGKDTEIDFAEKPEYAPDAMLAELCKLLNAYTNPDQGYTAKRMIERQTFEGDYDHLARFGEWDLTQSAKTRRLP